MLATAGAATPPGLMPLPSTLSLRSGSLPIDSGFRIRVTGVTDPRLDAAVERLRARVLFQTGISPIASKSGAVLTIDCRERGPEYPTLGEDESYRLDVDSSASRLSARTTTGALRGMETFSQLIAPGPDGFQIPGVHIEDRPRFPWRGLMLDVARHFMPVDVVKRNLDAMAAVKLNVFHWHLSDDQGFRVESRRFPKLQQLGSDGMFYTQAEIRQVVEYARERGIRVIPEFDIPGHTTSWVVGYPELASAPGPYQIQRRWGVFEPTMDPTREETYRFLDGFLGEIAALFPDPYFHIGGDEVEETQWKNSPSVQAFARDHHLATSREIQGYFNRRVQDILRKHGKIMIGWDEVLAPGLANDTVIQSWRGPDSLADASKKGYRGILSSGYYLDHLKSAAFHYAVDPMAGAAGALDSEHAAHILGGEACMWAEYINSETIDSRVWPRMAAIAERFWSPKETTDVDSMYRRLETVSRGLAWTGLHHRTEAEALERLAGGQPEEPLRVLADACEALGIEIRRDARHYTSLVDLNRFVDAVRPESETVRHLNRAAVSAAANASTSAMDLAELRVRLRQWAENDARLVPMMDGNIFLRELAPLSQRLTALGGIGLQALDYLTSGKSAPPSWVAAQLQTLDNMDAPSAEVSLAAVRPIRLLLKAVSHESGANPGNLAHPNNERGVYEKD